MDMREELVGGWKRLKNERFTIYILYEILLG
jgi:hypothetical protein